MDFHKSLTYRVQSGQTTRFSGLCSRPLIISIAVVLNLSEDQITGFSDEFYDEKQMPKCSSEIHTRNYAQKTRSKKFRRGCRNCGHDENCFFVQRRITYLLIRWKCSDSRSEAAWPLAHKNVRIANNPWNSFHPGLHCFQIPSLSDLSASFTLVTADYGSTELAIQLIPEETRSLQWCHKTRAGKLN